ncbi:MAG: hypothetical protein AAF519_04955 [Bacteroidota bacterium]
MASRQIRLNTPAIIKEKLPEIYGKYANIVMQTGEVFFVKIEASDAEIIEYSDMRLTKNKLQIAEVSEIIVDVPA